MKVCRDHPSATTRTECAKSSSLLRTRTLWALWVLTVFSMSLSSMYSLLTFGTGANVEYNIRYLNEEALAGFTKYAPSSIAIFYNVFSGRKRRDKARSLRVVKEQLEYWRKSRISNSTLHYMLLGQRIEMPCNGNTTETCEEIGYKERGDEIPMLQYLHEYCVRNPRQTVVYIHNKGSFHDGDRNAAIRRLRRLLTNAVFSDQCTEIHNREPKCNVCSARFSPIPHWHTSGNMWVAKCDYVRGLVEPKNFAVQVKRAVELAQQRMFHRKQLNTSNFHTGMNEYASEHWVHTHAHVRPCDVYTGPWTWSSENIRKVEEKPQFKRQMAPRFPRKAYRLLGYEWSTLEYRLFELSSLYMGQPREKQTPPPDSWVWKFYPPYEPLWYGDSPKNDSATTKVKKVNIVIAHCLRDLNWLRNYTEGHIGSIHDITVISKCGREPVGLDQIPSSVKQVIRTENVGRCDHSYAHYIVRNYHQHNPSSPPARPTSSDNDGEKEIYFFLKDNRDIHQPGKWRSFDEMLRIASQTGFACGMKPAMTRIDWNAPTRNRVVVSPVHETAYLRNFTLGDYANQYNETNKVHFKSEYKDLGEWMESIPIDFEEELVPVCYGGHFATTRSSIQKQPLWVWQAIEKSLSRGDNIEEGHFAERSWAGLLSPPIPKEKVKVLRDISAQASENKYIPGALVIDTWD